MRTPPAESCALWCACNCIAPGARLVDPYGEGLIWLVVWDRDLSADEIERLEAFERRRAELEG